MRTLLKPAVLIQTPSLRSNRRTNKAWICSASDMARVVLWFKNDLRVKDNYILDHAADLVAKGKAKEILPVYCFDPRHFELTPWGNPKTGSYRSQFLLESVIDLKNTLRSLDSDLVIKLGRPEEIIPGLFGKQGGFVVTQQEFAFEEKATFTKLSKALKEKANLETLWDGTLYHIKDLPFAQDMQDMPDVFTPFRGKVEHKCEPRAPSAGPQKGQLPLPGDIEKDILDYRPAKVEDLNGLLPHDSPKLSTPDVHPKAVLDFKGGESVAQKRLKYYLWDTDLVADYFNIRNGMLGGDYSTKLSAWLAHGCISPRYIANQIQHYQSQRKSNKSTYWVLFELLWRDYFRFFTIKHGSKIFLEGGVTGQKKHWTNNEDLFKRWKDGTTGMPLIDANMRELKSTGFMSNRGRQNVASYLVLDLGIDWRKGADWFESVLTDYDVASNWGNWVSAAGLTGGRVNHFNTVKQSKDYDKDGEYIKAWVPELAKVPVEKIHAPFSMTKEEQEASGVIIGKDYPYPPKSHYDRSDEGRGAGRGHGGRGRGGRGGKGGRGGTKGRNNNKNQGTD